MEKVRFVVVGCGHIGKRHAELVRRNPEGELVALIDINEAVLADAGTQFGVPVYNSLEAFLESGAEADVINICTPNGYHASQAKKAIEKGFHVVVEKPLGLTKAECEEVIYKGLHHSRNIFCVMQNRYSPPSEWLKSVISNGVLGDIFMVQINCYWNRDERYYKKGGWKGSSNLDGGTLFTQFSHFIDIMYWLFGDIEDIQGKFVDFNHSLLTDFEDSGMINFRFVNGGIGAINYSTSVWDNNLESSITIIGQNGTIKVGGQYMDRVDVCHIKDYTMPELAPTNEANDYGHYKGSAANHVYTVQNVIDTLKGRSAATTNALEGLKVVEIIERIYKQRPPVKTLKAESVTNTVELTELLK
jgi:predicted dehydrogenase